MSFGVSGDNAFFEWSSVSFMSFVGSKYRLLDPQLWRLIFDIIRFNYFATDILSETLNSSNSSTSPRSCHKDRGNGENGYHINKEFESIGTYLNRHGYSEHFQKYYLIPMVAAPWCIDPDDFSDNFPAYKLIQFM